MEINLNSIVSFLTSPDIQAKLFWVKIGFLSVGGIFLAGIIYVLSKSHYLEWTFNQDLWGFFTFRPFGAKRITRNWKKTLRRLETGSESEYKLALIEADNMLNNSLKRMRYHGQTLEERLQKLTSATLPNIEDIYKAHQLRNNIFHDPDYRLTLDEAKRTIEVYEKAFTALQILT